METKEFYSADGRHVSEISQLEPGILLLSGLGPPDEHAAAEISGYMNHLFEIGGVRGLVVDGTKGFSPNQEAIQLFAKSARFPFVGRIGIFGLDNPLTKLAVRAIAKGAGREETIKLLGTQEEALAFVKNDPNNTPTS